jgi:hypothetical protein
MQSLRCIAAWYGDRRSHHHQTPQSFRQHVHWAAEFRHGVGQAERENSRPQGTQCLGLPSHCRRETILPLALSYFQPDKVPRRLVGIRQGPPRCSGSRHPSTEQQQLTWPPLPDQVKRSSRRTSACFTLFVDYPQAAILLMRCALLRVIS